MKNDQLVTQQRWGDEEVVFLYKCRQSMYRSELFAKLKRGAACVLLYKTVKM
jgi:hypothetical protein